MKFLRISLVLFILFSNTLSAQLFKDSREMFLEAESYFLFEEYIEALPLYLTLGEENPENDYINYKIGICYLNTPGQKERSIEYLEKAKENINWKLRQGRFRTTQAPADLLFYLGKAYHINYQFKIAIDYYNRFKNEANPKIYNFEMVDEHITASKNAMETVGSPLFFGKKQLDEPINSRFSEFNPVVSGNEQIIVFSRKLPFYDGIFYSKKTDGEWSDPLDITPMIGSDGDTYPTSLSHDGTELYIYKLDDYVGNIYTSKYVNEEWTRLIKLNENINTKYWESHASISSDGQKLYFTSNRPGGVGGLDIYVSERMPDGDWGSAKNPGKPINTVLNEETPFITEDNKTLYYSSYSHYNIGGYDVFYSTKLDDGTWSVPLNAGYPISTPDDDLFFYPLKNGRYAYIARPNPEKINAVTDLYRLEIYSDARPGKFSIAGIMSLTNNTSFSPASKISVIKIETGDTIFVVVPDPISGNFEFELTQGNYKVIFSEKDFESKDFTLNLPINSADSEISLSAVLYPVKSQIELVKKSDVPWWTDTIEVTNKLGIAKHQIRTSNSDPVEIKMDLDKNTKLRIEKWTDNKLVKVDSFDIKSKQFSYILKPLPGKSAFKIYYLDTDNQLIRDELSVTYVPEIEPEIHSLPTLKPLLLTFYNELLKATEGNLKQNLLQIDLQKEGITNPEELINYLIDQSGKNNYSESDVRIALLNMASKNKTNVSAFLSTLIIQSKDTLYYMFSEIDLELEAITTIPQLIQMIDKKSTNSLSQKNNLVELATKLALEDLNRRQQELSILYYELLKYSDVKIREALLDIETRKTDIQDTGDLIRMLLAKKDEYGYHEKDIEKILLTIIDSKNNDVPDLRKKWVEMSDSELSTIISKTQPSKSASADFSTYASQVILHADRSGIKQNQVINSIAALAISESLKSNREMTALYYNMLRLADGNLKLALQHLDPEKKQILTSKELTDFLITEYETFDYQEKDVTILLARISAEKGLERFLSELTYLSSGNLQEVLKSIDLKRENIQTADELTELVLEKTSANRNSYSEILTMIGQIALSRSAGNQLDMYLLKQNLSVLGMNKIRLAITNIDSPRIKLTTPQNLVDYLTEIADSAGFASENIWDVIFELGSEGQRNMNELISSLKKIADQKIVKALIEIEKKKIPVAGMKELMDYLISGSEEFGYSEKDIQNLMLDHSLENQKTGREKQEEKSITVKTRYLFYLILLLIAVILSYGYLRKVKKQ